jgi:L-ribulose-5-phosphate 3-epimerase
MTLLIKKPSVRLGFEPEPGMFIDTAARAEQLLDRLGRPAGLGLTVDIGHLECLGERPLAATVARVASQIVNVHIDDMLVCRHEHLPLGAGEVEFGPVLRELARAGYQGGLHIELPRQSHRWLATAAESLAFLTRALRAAGV